MIRVQTLKAFHVAVLSCALFGACNLNEFTVNTTAPVMYAAAESFAAESDVDLAREAAAGQLKTADGFLVSAPKNRVLLEVLARGYLEYAFGFLEDELDALPDDNAHQARREVLTHRATVLYDRALGFALRNLATFNKDFVASTKSDLTTLEATLDKLPKAAAPGLLYGGMAWASSINLNRSDIARVADLAKAIAMVKRSYTLDKTLYNAGAAMTLGLFHASQGRAMGGNPEASKTFFEEAISLTQGKYLLTKVMEARFYAVIMQDRPLYERLLTEVINMPADVMPSARLPNELAKRRAARYLKNAEDVF